MLRLLEREYNPAMPDRYHAVLNTIGYHDPAVVLDAVRSLLTYRPDAWLRSIDVPCAVVMTTSDRVVPPFANCAWPAPSRTAASSP